jgi:hypothetical protein
MEKEAIQLYADPALKRRVEKAAAKYNIPVEEYLIEAIEQKLAEDAKQEDANAEDAAKPKGLTPQLLAEMRELRERILAERGGKPIEIDILEQVRNERDDELANMR